MEDSDAGKIEGKSLRGQQRMRRLDGITEQTQGDNEGLGNLACCSLRGRKESGTT